MNRATLEWYELLARGLVWAAGIVLLLSIIGAIVIAGSDSAVPAFADAERQGRGIASLASLGGGLTGAGLLGGLGAILRLMVLERLEKLGPEPDSGSKREESVPPLPSELTKPAKSSKSSKSARERSRQRSEAKPKERSEKKPEKREEG